MLLCPLLWPATVNTHTLYMMLFLNLPILAYNCVVTTFPFILATLINCSCAGIITIFAFAAWKDVNPFFTLDDLLFFHATVLLFASLTFFRGINFALYLEETFFRKKKPL